MRAAARALLAAAACAAGAGCAAPRAPGAGDGVRLDAEFARLALEEVRTGDPRTLAALARTPAAAHLLAHARTFQNDDVPRDSAAALVAALLAPSPRRDAAAAACPAALAYFTGPLDADRGWIEDVRRYLPHDPARPLRATLFLTLGYDIGVAVDATASLNCGHPHFAGRPRELRYYAIHELHHAGFMAYQPPVPFSRVRTCADLVEVVRRHTQLEGMAVWAAHVRRVADGAVEGDEDDVALEDAAEMRREEARYLALSRALEARGAAPVDDAAWAVVAALSGERLRYRVGALMARRIERAQGREALAALVAAGADRFAEAAARSAMQAP